MTIEYPPRSARQGSNVTRRPCCELLHKSLDRLAGNGSYRAGLLIAFHGALVAPPGLSGGGTGVRPGRRPKGREGGLSVVHHFLDLLDMLAVTAPAEASTAALEVPGAAERDKVARRRITRIR